MAESKLEEILKVEKPGTGKPVAGQADLRTTLERELEGEDSELAKELQRTRAEEIIARRRIAIDRMRAGQSGQDTGGSKIQEHGKDWLTDIAQSLLDRGLDQRVVGDLIDHLLGTARAPLVGLPGAPAPAQGMTFTDMMAFYKMVQESNKSDPAIAAILEKLTDRFTALETKANLPREAPAKTNYILVKADGTIREIEAGKPIILEPVTPTISGEPIEVVKEKNRQAERMYELETERNYKEKLASVAEEIPVSFGMGVSRDNASRQVKTGTPPSAAEKGSVTSFPCKNPNCKATIFVPPDMPAQIKCAKCGLIHQKEETPDEAPSPPAS